jgi:tetratricopeptide (TPR) repeat protein
MPLHHLYESGEYAEAADRGRELIEAHPEYAGPLYNLACCESLAGRTAEAIEHLRLAIARAERFRSLATEDSDFDPIRDEPAFKELVSSRVAEPATGLQPPRAAHAQRRSTPVMGSDGVRGGKRQTRVTFANAGPSGRRLSGAAESSDLVNGHRPRKALELKLTNRNGVDGFLDGRVHARPDEHLRGCSTRA